MLDAAMRAIAALAMLGAPPDWTVWTARACTGVATPVVGVELPPPGWRSEGSVGSTGISPFSCRERIFRSKRLICLSSCD